MIAGIAGALLVSYFVSGVDFLFWFPALFAVSLAGCLVGTYTAPPTNSAVLESFYKSVNPWGFWRPVMNAVMQKDTSFQPNKDFKLDMFNILLGIVAQTCLVVLPMYFILFMKVPLAITLSILLMVIVILKFTWWDKLKKE